MVTLVNITDEPLHFPHIAVFAAKGDKYGQDKQEVSEENAEILLRNKSLRRQEGKHDSKAVKGVSTERSMKGIEPK